METAAPEQIKLFPELSYHYSLGLHELCTMPLIFLRLYIEKLPGLKAEHQLARIQATLAPNYKEDDLSELLDELSDIVEKSQGQVKEAISEEMLQLKLATLGVGFKVVDDA